MWSHIKKKGLRVKCPPALGFVDICWAWWQLCRKQGCCLGFVLLSFCRKTQSLVLHFKRNHVQHPPLLSAFHEEKKTKTSPSAVYSQHGVLLKIKLYHVNTESSTYFLHAHLALAVLENKNWLISLFRIYLQTVIFSEFQFQGSALVLLPAPVSV